MEAAGRGRVCRCFGWWLAVSVRGDWIEIGQFHIISYRWTQPPHSTHSPPNHITSYHIDRSSCIHPTHSTSPTSWKSAAGARMHPPHPTHFTSPTPLHTLPSTSYHILSYRPTYYPPRGRARRGRGASGRRSRPTAPTRPERWRRVEWMGVGGCMRVSAYLYIYVNVSE